ncbi:YafY family transcriptional regulator [Xylanibacillus composti]|uniref:Transcriptional regulator n=1 Tax=Xylanibacillus composti TaxID=1572762 RepID=A0A8J4GZJ8_9BACL|nr:YafY family protein [Xylanibacillus composti]MDT9724880.1 YafY family transcriptional regulator [Xylanibacillus composti]GIQ68113.1 transcriptional regulator [Xylanibacillus composti]
MRADRLVQIMILLQNNGKMTTGELARTLEVSERTIIRDMDALSISGIPVVSERGKSGGWRLLDGFRSRLHGLKLEEWKSLFILPSEKLLEDLGVQAKGPQLRHKLLASIPQESQPAVQPYMEKILIDTESWKPSHTDSASMNQVLNALWSDRKLQMVYTKADGTRTTRIVHPLGLVSKGSVWYLVASLDEGEIRSFRMSRVEQAEQLEETFIRPQHFSLADYWMRSKQAFVSSLPSLEVKLLVDREVVGRLTFTDKFVQKVHMDEKSCGEQVRVTLSFHTEEEAVAYVLGWGGKVRLLGPAHLAELIVQRAREVVAMYGGAPGPAPKIGE